MLWLKTNFDFFQNLAGPTCKVETVNFLSFIIYFPSIPDHSKGVLGHFEQYSGIKTTNFTIKIPLKLQKCPFSAHKRQIRGRIQTQEVKFS